VLFLAYDGASRCGTARHENVTVPRIRDLVLRFKENGFDGGKDQKPTGAPSCMNSEQRQNLGVESRAVMLWIYFEPLWFFRPYFADVFV